MYNIVLYILYILYTCILEAVYKVIVGTTYRPLRQLDLKEPSSTVFITSMGARMEGNCRCPWKKSLYGGVAFFHHVRVAHRRKFQRTLRSMLLHAIITIHWCCHYIILTITELLPHVQVEGHFPTGMQIHNNRDVSIP